MAERTDSNPCAKCSIRQMRIVGCCVGDDIPDGLPTKTIRNCLGNRITACEYLDPTGEGNRCTNPNPPQDCRSFRCYRFFIPMSKLK